MRGMEIRGTGQISAVPLGDYGFSLRRALKDLLNGFIFHADRCIKALSPWRCIPVAKIADSSRLPLYAIGEVSLSNQDNFRRLIMSVGLRELR
jgi:hypothetical protein